MSLKSFLAVGVTISRRIGFAMIGIALVLIASAYCLGVMHGRSQVREASAQQQAVSFQRQIKQQQTDRAELADSYDKLTQQRYDYDQAINSNEGLKEWRQLPLDECARVLSAGPGVPAQHPCRVLARPDVNTTTEHPGRSDD